MVRLKSCPPLNPRKVPLEERVLVDFLSKEMHSGGLAPSTAELANHAVEAGTFMSLNMPSGQLREFLSGRRLIDLGAGFTSGMERFSESYGVGEYVAVDFYVSYAGRKRAGSEFVNDDILRYLAIQPDSSANICMNAINEEILLHPSLTVMDSYGEMLLRSISRVVYAGGIAFGMQSPLLHELDRFGFERMDRLDTVSVTSFGALYRKPQ